MHAKSAFHAFVIVHNFANIFFISVLQRRRWHALGRAPTGGAVGGVNLVMVTAGTGRGGRGGDR